MSAAPNEYDGRWRPERDVSGRWSAFRYVDHGPELADRYEREDDVEYRNGYRIPRNFDTMAECEERCRELNGEKE